MSKKVQNRAIDKQKQLQQVGRVIFTCVSFIGIYVSYSVFGGIVDIVTLFLLVVASGVLVMGFVLIRTYLTRKNLLTQDFWLLLCWVMLVAMFYIWLQMVSDSIYSDMEYYMGVTLLLVALTAYSLAFASLWNVANLKSQQKKELWKKTLIDRPYFRPSTSLVLTLVSCVVLLYRPGVPDDIFATNYQQMVQIVGCVNLLVALIAVILSIISIFKVWLWFKIIFIVSTLIGLWVVAFQILGIALSGGTY